MARRSTLRPARQVYRPAIDVRPWTDPVSGQRYFRATGPFQISDPRQSILTHGELLMLKAKLDEALGMEAAS